MNKKQLLAILLASVIGSTSLTGCGGFVYGDSNGIVIVTGTISYDDLKELKLVHLTNDTVGIDKIVLIEEKLTEMRRSPDVIRYYDIETDIKYYDSSLEEDYKNFNYEIILDNLVDYLYKYNMVKEEYTIEEVQSLKEKLLQDETVDLYKEKTNKILEKTK